MQKTNIFFSKNTSRDIKAQIVKESGARLSGDSEKYLGLPSMVGKSKYKTFGGIKERVWNKVRNLKNNSLTQVGNDILIKVVIQAIPSYAINVFRLPKQLCK